MPPRDLDITFGTWKKRALTLINRLCTSYKLSGRESENVVKIESDNTLLSKHNYSVSAEREADVLAFEIFKNSGYSTEDLEDIFTILLYAHMPLDGEAIDIEEIFHNQMPLSNNFKSKFPDIAVFSENDINDESTHPSLLERKNTLNAALENIQTVNKDSFLVSENTFKAIKTLSQESLSFLFLSSNQIIEAIYSAARIKSLYEEKDLSCKINNTAHRVSRSQMIKITDFRNCTSLILIKFVRN